MHDSKYKNNQTCIVYSNKRPTLFTIYMKIISLQHRFQQNNTNDSYKTTQQYIGSFNMNSQL